MSIYRKKLNSLAIDIFKKYKESPTFQASIYSANQRYFLKEIIDMESLCNNSNVESVNFYPKKEEAFDVYPLQYLEHKIKENKLELKLKNKKIIFDLK
ncbi:MAG TPA: hypothetical protein VJ895_00860 [Candidatus Nanoarchaeia archaeon]|nr:hypothetical protein [Candidatus Nanoarchaeia archaeon]